MYQSVLKGNVVNNRKPLHENASYDFKETTHFQAFLPSAHTLRGIFHYTANGGAIVVLSSREVVILPSIIKSNKVGMGSGVPTRLLTL